MRRTSLGFTLLAFVTGASVAAAATNPSPIRTVATTTLSMDGKFSTHLLSWEGGDVRGAVLLQPVSSGGPASKTVSSPVCAPLIVEVAFPPPDFLTGWINQLCANQSLRRNLVLTDYDAEGAPLAAFEVREAVLTEVTFPAFDATSTSAGPMKLVFTPEQSRAVAPAGTKLAVPKPRAYSGRFILSIDGLETSAASRIEPLTVKLVSSTTETGVKRIASASATSVEFSNIRVTASAARTDTWQAWHTQFVVNGNSSDANEKRGTMMFMAPDGKPSDLALNFSQVGILRVSRLPVPSGTMAKAEAEFYFERMTLGAPAATMSSASTESTTPVNAPAPVGQTEPLSPATTQPTVGTRTPIMTEVPLTTQTAVTPVAVAAVLNPADQGSRDPAAFPRADGLTRTTYSGTFQKTYTNESATYTSPETIYQLVAKVDAAAKAAGWTLTSLSEADSPNGKSVSEGWTKPQATASVSFLGPRDGSGTKLSVQVYVQIPVAN